MWRSFRYGAVAALAIVFGLAAPIACLLGAVGSSIVGFGFANWGFMIVAGLFAVGFVGTVFINIRLVIPAVRFCIQEARGL